MNLHGSYPASTSTQDSPTGRTAELTDSTDALAGAEPAELIANEAQALLDAAASEQTIETERLRNFARACLEVSEAGRLALAVLDGGLFAPRRALELAVHMLNRSKGADKRQGNQKARR